MDPSLRRHMRHAAVTATLAFVLLSGALAYWQIYRSAWLLHQVHNRHWKLLERQIRRGSIYDAQGKPLAVGLGAGSFHRSYPQGALCAHIIGYLSDTYGRTGLEGKLDSELSGMGASPNPLTVNPLLSGLRKRGDNVFLTLDLRVQKAAAAALGGRKGAVVAIEPSTGRILALVSNPSFDPSQVDEQWQRLSENRDSPLFDRALEGLFQPGSTFKMLTASAALETGTDSPDDPFYCPGYINIPGGPKGTYTIHEMGGEVHGHLTLAMALAQSCNITFAQVGLRLGATRFKEFADRFWVDRPLDFILPTATGQVTSSRSDSGSAGGKSDPRKDLGLLRVPTVLAQSAFGQGQVLISPLEDCMIAAAVANHGVLMKPYLVDRIVDPWGNVVARAEPTILSKPISSSTAAEVTSMMELTMTAGTARHLQVPGLLIAGKTGTAQNPGHRTHAWFAGFAPAERPRVVAACIVEHGGVGGVEAGPVVIATLLAALHGQR